jgi:hypothetical protein
LVAEEVAELFPELVTRGGDGRPFGVRYELLSVLLLGELQKELARNDKQEQHLEELGTRLAALEDGESDDADAERGATHWKASSGFSH